MFTKDELEFILCVFVEEREHLKCISETDLLDRGALDNLLDGFDGIIDKCWDMVLKKR